MEESKSVDQRRYNFTIIDNEIIDRIAEIGPYALSVYLLLVKMANSDNKCFPGQAYIARTTGISERKVRSSIEILEKSELITVTRSTGFQNTYFIHPVEKAIKDRPPRHAVQGTPARGALPPRHVVPTNNTHVIRQEEQEPAGEKRGLTIDEQLLIPTFKRIITALEEPDLPPTSKRLATLREALHDINIGGHEKIIEAALNLNRSPEVDSHKRYDWLLNKFDFTERITTFLTMKASGRSIQREPEHAPAGWRLPQ